ncbi:MAG: hypothetical protein AVDCRST_MAG02-2471 [uncultured Rubrobacteraceae bacterium]|uniref:Uncharacterized protein n=1 Tax=uncultured Rubrobacteraceae bacterium TaxID=349277 RepID=A0A6J4QWG7_9ACTN|nr:MAG: hypothetical protein AVDCRST_MAG02-2471 [uncultured Rubrobacteraceae bacterium]
MTDRPTAETAYEDELTPEPIILLAGAAGDLGGRIKPVMTDTAPVPVVEDNLLARKNVRRALARPSSGSSPLEGPLASLLELAREAS